MRRKFDRQLMKELWLEGYSAEEITECIGAKSVTNVRDILREMGLKVRNGVDRGRIRALHKAGWAIPDIATDCGCFEEQVIEVIENEISRVAQGA